MCGFVILFVLRVGVEIEVLVGERRGSYAVGGVDCLCEVFIVLDSLERSMGAKTR